MTVIDLFGCENYFNCVFFGKSVPWYSYYAFALGSALVVVMFVLLILLITNKFSKYNPRGKV